MATGVLLLLLMLVPQCASARFVQLGGAAGYRFSLVATQGKDSLIVQTATPETTIPHAPRDLENGTYYVNYVRLRSTIFVPIGIIEQEHFSFDIQPLLSGSAATRSPSSTEVRRALKEFIAREPQAALKAILPEGSLKQLHQAADGTIRRVIWPNVGLFVLQLGLLVGGVLCFRWGWRGYRHWILTAHKRCGKCGYAKAGLHKAISCPECGESWTVPG